MFKKKLIKKNLIIFVFVISVSSKSMVMETWRSKIYSSDNSYVEKVKQKKKYIKYRQKVNIKKLLNKTSYM